MMVCFSSKIALRAADLQASLSPSVCVSCLIHPCPSCPCRMACPCSLSDRCCSSFSHGKPLKAGMGVFHKLLLVRHGSLNGARTPRGGTPWTPTSIYPASEGTQGCDFSCECEQCPKQVRKLISSLAAACPSLLMSGGVTELMKCKILYMMLAAKTTMDYKHLF